MLRNILIAENTRSISPFALHFLEDTLIQSFAGGIFFLFFLYPKLGNFFGRRRKKERLLFSNYGSTRKTTGPDPGRGI